ARWNNELDLRSIKSTMQMDELRCKTPELVRKEIWTHVLAYNLIRTLAAQAAATHELLPRSISFKGAMQTLEAFQPLIEFLPTHNAAHLQELYQHLLRALATHHVASASPCRACSCILCDKTVCFHTFTGRGGVPRPHGVGYPCDAGDVHESVSFPAGTVVPR